MVSTLNSVNLFNSNDYDADTSFIKPADCLMAGLRSTGQNSRKIAKSVSISGKDARQLAFECDTQGGCLRNSAAHHWGISRKTGELADSLQDRCCAPTALGERKAPDDLRAVATGELVSDPVRHRGVRYSTRGWNES